MFVGAGVALRATSGAFVQIQSGGVSDVGRVRSNNEDCFRIVAPQNLFVLSDGMGGEAHGEIASALAVETVVHYCVGGDDRPPTSAISGIQPIWNEKTKRLYTSFHLANKAIFDSAEKHPEQAGMGATLTAMWIDGAKVSVAHVGDSRAYLLRGGALQQLTTDHSLVAEQVRRGVLTAAEAEVSSMQSVLLRALGAQPQIEVDAEEHTLFDHDTLLLCSDGLTRMVTEPEIAGALQAEPDPVKAAEKLVGLANEYGGGDNVTVLVLRISSESKGWFSWLRRGARKTSTSNGSAGRH
jgi:serine/threonine protein phosphatase PrpC